MPRSVWKGLFCDNAVIDRVQKILNAGGPKVQKESIKIWSRRSAILPAFVGYRFDIHNGKSFIPLEIKPTMIGHKFGEFSLTRKILPVRPARTGTDIKSKPKSAAPAAKK